MDNPVSTSTAEEATLNAKSLNDWQVLSPVAILYFATSVFKHLFSNVIYLIPAVAVSYKSLLDHPYIWFPSLLVALCLLLLFAFVSFKVYRYRLTDDSIEIRSGIFSKKHLNLPFSRVQNVKIEQPIYYRFTGHACLQLDTAGSAKNEAKLVAIKLDFAQQLKTRIQCQVMDDVLIKEQGNLAIDVTGQDKTEKETILNQRKLSDLVIHGITSNRIWILLGGMAPFYDNIVDTISQWVSSLGVNLSDLFSLQTHSMLEVGLYALTLTMLVMFILVSFSVIGAIISFHGYTLSKLGDKYVRRSGLFTKHEVSMALSRLQMVVRKQDWLDLLLDRINLKFEQSNSFASNLDPSAASSKIVVPSIRPNECQALIDDAYPNNTLPLLIKEDSFVAISKVFIIRNIVFILMPMWLVAFGFSLLNEQVVTATVISALFIGLSGLVVLRWKRWGIAKDDSFIYIRQGLIGVDYYCFATYKLQQTQVKQNVLMKRKHLATVKFVLASGSLVVPLLSERLVYRLIDEGLYQVESCNKSWM